MDKYEKVINKSKLQIFTTRETTFFSSLLAQLKIEWVEHIPTAATNGLSLYLNKKYIDGLSQEEVTALLLHETYHCALDHINRCKSADLNPMVYNIAGDYVINNDLDKQGWKLPQGGLIDHKYDGWSTRKVYDDIFDNAQHIKFEMDIIPNCPKEMSKEEYEETVTSNIVKAVTQARLANDYGSIPGEVAKKVEKILNPKLPWEQILQDHMSSYKKEDYTWSRPNRRYWPDMYLPSMKSESLDQISIGIDTSGSITQEHINAFMAEVKYINDVLKPKAIRIMTFDTRIRSDATFEEGESIDDIKLLGGGGTSIHPLIRTLKEDSPEIAIIFTDLEFGMPSLSSVQSDLFWIRMGKYENPPNKGVLIDYDS